MERLEGDERFAPAGERLGERVLGEGGVRRECAAGVRDAAVSDVDEMRGRKGCTARAQLGRLADTRAATATRIGGAGADPPTAVLEMKMVRGVVERNAVDLLEPIEVPVETIGEDAEGNPALCTPGEQGRSTGIEFDRVEERVERLLVDREIVEDLQVVFPGRDLAALVARPLRRPTLGRVTLGQRGADILHRERAVEITEDGERGGRIGHRTREYRQMPLSRSELADRLRSTSPLLLDGATGTELERRGVATRLPLWSAAALDSHPDTIVRIHTDYVAAGVDALTANTFRTQRRTLAHAGMGERAAELTRLAVELARSAADTSTWIFGSSPPLEDCYHPERVPDDADLAAEHAEHARHLADAGVDAVLVETMNTIREARAALLAAAEVGLPALAAFVCWDGARLLSGEPLANACTAAAEAGASAVLVNCLPPSNVDTCIDVLDGASLPFGTYPNLGEPEDTVGFRRSEDLSPEAFGQLAANWAARGARVLGGCCGTSPAHLAEVVRRCV